MELKGLILVYPCLEAVIKYESHFRYANTFALLSLVQMEYFWSLYLNDEDKDCNDYRACPMRTPQRILERFPPTLLILAKNDILLDEGLVFAKKLKNVNVSAETMVFNDSVHGFFFKLSSEKVTMEICDKINSMIH